ncbi:hypothetical protein F2P44_21285 [Massilia sp. CCM 8695]|uniref:Uncharacterized protein n=2 Tax=Massilia frigida TaxID=2609281 RepID=A0ABX0N9E7_9BURK|nr:hypothetical protein [Massilia frigida]
MLVRRDGDANRMRDLSEANAPAYGWIPDGIHHVDQRFNNKVGKKDYYTNQDQWAVRVGVNY